jgi:hypothetical protein
VRAQRHASFWDNVKLFKRRNKLRMIKIALYPLFVAGADDSNDFSA